MGLFGGSKISSEDRAILDLLQSLKSFSATKLSECRSLEKSDKPAENRIRISLQDKCAQALQALSHPEFHLNKGELKNLRLSSSRSLLEDITLLQHHISSIIQVVQSVPYDMRKTVSNTNSNLKEKAA